MTIHIEDLKFQCIIGILDFERTTPQDVIINLTLDYDYKGTFINYADVAELIKFEMKHNKFLLLENALNKLCEILVHKHISIISLNLKITKPSILSDCKVSVSTFYKS
ncbi:dihydroneopterin aldolase [bacterium]|nr:dihydroneopterin aldolase [bacterium]MBU1994814.1 dihydroneopterin aldolase [bacterium]